MNVRPSKARRDESRLYVLSQIDLSAILRLVVFAQVRDELLQHVQAAELDAADGAAEDTCFPADGAERDELCRHAVIKDATPNCDDRPCDRESEVVA